MKVLVPLALVLSITLTAKDGAKSGRAGNQAYERGSYEEAAGLYQNGMNQLQVQEPGLITHGLLNNMGSALYRMGEHDQATAAFVGAMDMAASDADFARAAYNAGNNAYRAQNAEAALDFYKNALLADPANLAAKYNYEFVKRQMQEQQEQQQEQNEQQEQQNQDQQDQQQQEQEQQQEQQDEQNENEQQQQQQQQEQEQQQQQQPEQEPQPDPNDLSQAQAEQILEALQTDEKDLLRDVKKMKARPRKVEKDW